MTRRAIVLGNSITLRNWVPRPVAADIIGTNLSWAEIDADVICCTETCLHMPDRPVYHTTEWASSGVWAMAWACEQDYDEIWLLAMEGTLADQMQRKSVVRDMAGGRTASLHWHEDWHWFALTHMRHWPRLRPVITGAQLRAFEAWTGWQRQDISEHAPPRVIESKVVADSLE